MKRYKLTADDSALRRAYLETYAGRDARKRLSRIHTELRIRQETVDRWMRDKDFVEELRAIDRRRLESALSFATTLWPWIVEEQARIALGEPEEPPDLTGRSPQEVRLLEDAYKARAAQRAKMSTRAAEFIADILGARKQGPQVAMFADKVETFGGLPNDIDGLNADIKRIDEIMDRAIARRAAEKARDDEGQGDGCGPHQQ